MNRQKIGQVIFWFGVICIIAWQALTWLQSQTQRAHTAEELSGTIHAVWGILFWIRIMGGSGLTFTIVGALLYTGPKGSYFWLLGFLPNVANFGQYWHPIYTPECAPDTLSCNGGMPIDPFKRAPQIRFAKRIDPIEIAFTAAAEVNFNDDGPEGPS